MNIHKNARLTPKGREFLVNLITNGLSLKEASRTLGVSERTAGKWYRRFQNGGLEALFDRSSRPLKLRNPTPQNTINQIIALRHQRLTGKHIARLCAVSPATVSRILQRAGLSRIKDLEPKEPGRRYVYDNPGDMIHLDIKRFSRFERPGHRVTGSRVGHSTPRPRTHKKARWEYLHVCIDDASRIAFTDIFPNERAQSAIDFLLNAVKYYQNLGVKISRVMTDNGPCYTSHAFAAACKQLGLKHVRTKPYTPRTNGKAERFIQTAIREWAYSRAYQSSQQRKSILPKWTHMYNWHRPHGGIKDQTPISKLGFKRNNLLINHN